MSPSQMRSSTRQLRAGGANANGCLEGSGRYNVNTRPSVFNGCPTDTNEIRHITWKTDLAKGMTQKQLAERTGLSRTAITMIESGQRNPTLFVCHALALALKVPLSVVIEDAERRGKRDR